MPAQSAFTYHVDTGGYDAALARTGRGPAEELAFFVAVDGSHFAGLLSPPTCGRWPDGHLDLDTAAQVPNLKDRHPLNLGAGDYLEVSPLPTAVLRMEGKEVSTYAFFTAPIALTENKNETGVPDDVTTQTAEVGVTAATPTYMITGAPTPPIGGAPSADFRATSEASPAGPSGEKPGGNP